MNNLKLLVLVACMAATIACDKQPDAPASGLSSNTAAPVSSVSDTTSPDTAAADITSSAIDDLTFSLEQELDNFITPRIDAEPPIAFALPARGSLEAKSDTVGNSNGGTEFLAQCPAEQVLVGISGRAGDAIDQVQPICVESDTNGNWVGAPTHAGEPFGGGGGGVFSTSCAQNFAIVGINGAEHNRRIAGSLQLFCRRLDGSFSTTGAIINMTRHGGPSRVLSRSRNHLCADAGVAIGLHGRAGRFIDRVGLLCREKPHLAGRWSNLINWPIIAVHSILTPQGKVFSFGTDRAGQQGAQFYYDLWDPKAGTSPTSHTTLENTLGVDSFCSSAIVLPESGNVLMPGGDGRPLGRRNSGIIDVPLFNTQTNSLSRAADLSFSRWYATAPTLTNGEILVTGGRTANHQIATTPEIYSPQRDEWRSLFGVNTAVSDWYYPRQWIAPNGRIFGITNDRMYFMDTAGQGSLIDAGPLPVAFGFTSTAVMYQPGKVLQVGGSSNNGRSALTVDINSDPLDVRVVSPMTQGRSSWANAVVLPDGKVLVVGGGMGNNQGDLATLYPEVWDPVTNQWSVQSSHQLMRLYHSTALLLPDASVLLAGGGAPGPLTNLNAEIFRPTYLFDDTGARKVRPVIDWAPDNATWGEQITVRASQSDISRITLIKTSTVTHATNFEQRFMELVFSTDSDGLQVAMPANVNLAPPGHYMLYILDATGTPSEARIIQIGNTPAPAAPQLPQVTTVDPAQGGNNLLVNGGFESGKDSWQDCANPAFTQASNAASQGASALALEPGACIFQEFDINAATTYDIACDIAHSDFSYGSLSVQYYDSSFTELSAESLALASGDYSILSTTLAAPGAATIGAITLYSEGNTLVDSCMITASDTVAPPIPVVVPTVSDNQNFLTNGGFEQGKSAWLDCAGESLTQSSQDSNQGDRSLQVSDAGCIFQEFVVTAGKDYRLRCDAKSLATDYSSMSLQISDNDFVALNSSEIPVGNNIFRNYEATINAPENGSRGAVTLYSEDTAVFDSCSVEEL